MSFLLFNYGFLDQRGGTIVAIPQSFTHVPRFDGNTIQIPPGLIVRNNEPFTWSIITVDPSIISISNEKTATPTILVDSQSFSIPQITLRVSIDKNPSIFRDYIIFTSLVSRSNLLTPSLDISLDSGFSLSNQINFDLNVSNSSTDSPSNYYVKIGAIDSEFGVGSTNITLESYSASSGWVLVDNYALSPSAPYVLVPLNEGTTYRVKPFSGGSSGVLGEYQYFSIEESDLYLDSSSLLLRDTKGISINLPDISSIVEGRSFYLSIELISFEDLSLLLRPTEGESILQEFNPEIRTFFLELLDLSPEDQTLLLGSTEVIGNNYEETLEIRVFWAKDTGV